MPLRILGWVGLSPLPGGLLLLLLWAVPPLRRVLRGAVYPVTLAMVALASLCTLLLLPHSGQDPGPVLEWLPGSGLIRFGLDGTGLYAALVTAWAALLVLLGTGPAAHSSAPSGALMLLALPAAGVAFLTHHFLARYAALEIVALCVALAPLAGGRVEGGAQRSSVVYLILRLGDAGLLAGILILLAASGTLDIDAALQSAQRLEGARLHWAVAGFVWAAWCKLGGWPFQLWIQAGRRLPPATQAWLYATLVPNLGLYLLYRVTPLLLLSGPLRGTVFWLATIGSAAAALLAFVETDLRSSLVHVAAAQGGVILLSAAAGAKPAAWLGLLVLTPLRLLLFLAADRLDNARSPAQHWFAAGLVALGGLALAAFGLLNLGWAREAGAAPGTLFAAEAAVALVAVWSVRAGWRVARGPSLPSQGTIAQRPYHWVQWTALGLLGCGVVAGGAAFDPLVRHLCGAASLALPAVTRPLAVLRDALSTPVLWAVLLLGAVAGRLQGGLARSPGGPDRAAGPGAGPAPEVHADAYDRAVAAGTWIVAHSADLTRRFAEQRILEGAVRGIARLVTWSGRSLYRAVEQGSLEGLMRRAVHGVLAASQEVRGWHTGRLRRNLLWVVAGLAVAIAALVFYGG
jgi:NADH:ubiquinone oxidoreductase subunit 5 (subunit L)/multisubunit Na+/H+ antiporter MnhA subunit